MGSILFVGLIFDSRNRLVEVIWDVRNENRKYWSFDCENGLNGFDSDYWSLRLMVSIENVFSILIGEDGAYFRYYSVWEEIDWKYVEKDFLFWCSYVKFDLREDLIWMWNGKFRLWMISLKSKIKTLESKVFGLYIDFDWEILETKVKA